MKRYLLFAACLVSTGIMQAQQTLNTAENAVRYTTDNLTGTARFRGLSGAMGAVGGDLSAMTINPAGAAIFNYNSGTASLSSYNVNNKSSYFGNTEKENYNNFDLNQIGAIFVFNNNNEAATVRKFTLGFNYENNNSFYNRSFSRGVNTRNSIDQYFLRYANGVGNEGAISLNTLNNAYFENLSYNDQQAYLGYNAYAFNPGTDPNGPAYVSNIPQTGNYYQENYTATSGFNGKVAFNFAAQLKERLYLGINLNAHFTDYIENTTFYEDPNNTSGSGMQEIQFDNQRYTYGGGFSFNLGAIYKFTEAFRAGIAYESPTWMTLRNEVSQRIASYCPECDQNSTASNFVFDPATVFVYDRYTIKNPAKWTASAAYVFGKSGLLSIDYTLKDYSNTEYKSHGYGAINDQLSSTLDLASTIRVGAEYRIKQLSLRAGYRYEESPYKTSRTIGDLNGATGGIGYSFGISRLDLAYSWYQRSYQSQMLPTAFPDSARIKSTNNNITLSYTIDL